MVRLCYMVCCVRCSVRTPARGDRPWSATDEQNESGERVEAVLPRSGSRIWVPDEGLRGRERENGGEAGGRLDAAERGLAGAVAGNSGVVVTGSSNGVLKGSS